MEGGIEEAGWSMVTPLQPIWPPMVGQPLGDIVSGAGLWIHACLWSRPYLWGCPCG